MIREFRIFAKAQIRAKEGTELGIEGYAAVFNQEFDSGWFRETILPGAFKRALKEKQDVRCLMNHDANLVLGRTTSGTLTMREDKNGLYFSCDLPDTQTGRDVRELIKRGDVSGCSFAFQAMAQNWREEKQADGSIVTHRELADVDLFDVGPVTYPAYSGTSVDARSLWPDEIPAEIREHIGELRDVEDGDPSNDDCQCDCAACRDGDCSADECDDENCDHDADEENSARPLTEDERFRMEARLRLGMS